eukprot:1112528-Pelagomonas_calceolata.AAC.2
MRTVSTTRAVEQSHVCSEGHESDECKDKKNAQGFEKPIVYIALVSGVSFPYDPSVYIPCLPEGHKSSERKGVKKQRER